MDLSLAEVKELFIQLWPPGRLYDWWSPSSFVSRFFDGIAEALKTFGFDLVKRLRREVIPSSAMELIPEWESALELAETETAQRGSLEQRRAAIVGRLRERDAFTFDLVRTALAPLLGVSAPATLRVLETDRAAMRVAHTYVHGYADGAGLPLVGTSLYVPDGGIVSEAGAHVIIEADGFDGPELRAILTAPDNRRAEWRFAATSPVSRVLFAPELAVARCNGAWHFDIFNEPTTGSLIVRSWSLFVEGVGPSGLACDLFDWGVYLDPAVVGRASAVDLHGARAALSRIQHAHTSGALILSLAALPDDARSLPDQCIPV